MKVVAAALLLALPAVAQTPPVKPPPPVPAVVINIEEDIIEAAPKRPQAEPITARPKAKPHKSLIRLRADFRAEVLGSVSQL